MKNILILTSSLFTDRILQFSSIRNVYPNANFTIWQTSEIQTNQISGESNFKTELFPKITPLPEKLNFLRKINDLAWSYKLNATSMLSMRNFRNQNKPKSFYYILIGILSWLVYFLGACVLLEKLIFKLALKFSRCEDVNNHLVKSAYSAILVTNPFWETEREVALEAKKLKIPVIALIPSWDNITTKSRLVFEPDAFMVWSDIRKKELNTYYPKSIKKSTFIVGAPQYDVFLNTDYYQTKAQFFSNLNLNPNKPCILYALGSPNFISSEYEGAVRFVDLFIEKELHLKYNLIIRPHPNKDTNSLQSIIKQSESIIIQKTKFAANITSKRTQDREEIENWVNTFRHCDVVINLFSTVIFDGLFFNKEIININFDPGTLGIYERFIKEINSEWNHLKPLFGHPALQYANSFEDIFIQLNLILELGMSKSENDKKALFEEVCGAKDGLNGERFGRALLSTIG
jgi:hypothetical protein